MVGRLAPQTNEWSHHGLLGSIPSDLITWEDLDKRNPQESNTTALIQISKQNTQSLFSQPATSASGIKGSRTLHMPPDWAKKQATQPISMMANLKDPGRKCFVLCSDEDNEIYFLICTLLHVCQFTK